MYLRFVLAARDSRTGEKQGLFTAAYDLLRSDALPDYEEQELRTALSWLERHLPIPTDFSRKRNAAHKNTHGISWIRSEAKDTISALRRIQAVLENQGTPVEVISTVRPGYVVYEDDHQIVAEPFHGEGA